MSGMNNSMALDAPRQPMADFEHIALLALVGVAGALQFSIAAAQILLTLAVLCWLALIVVRHERFEAPSFFRPLAIYGLLTLVSAAFSANPRASFVDSKQLVLFLLVPVAYRLMTGTRGFTLATVVVTCAAASAAIGIFQYGILHYDHLGQRPEGTLSHWMTYSGLLMLVFAIALARVLFGRGERTWAALVIPALVVAVAVTFTRGAMIGLCAAAAVLFALKDFRLFAVAPLVVAIFVAVAPGQISDRFASIFDRKNPTNMDRVAMLGEGERMIRAHPLTGVGPAMVQRLYAEYRGNDAVNAINPHLHNVPLQIAAERGIPALLAWLWFIVAVVIDLWTRFARSENRFLPAAALACVVALLVAGLFEYNFGDSEILMLFLIVVTLPAAAERIPHS
jgi:O-antigen ligase